MSPPIIRFPTTAWLTLATAGLATAAGLVIVLNFFAPRVLPPTFGDILDYLVVFLPLMTAVLLASLRWGQRSLAKDFGFSATWTDLLLGVAAGLLLRVGGMWLEVLFYGIRLTGGGTTLTPRSEGLIWVLVAVLAPIVIAPIIEELFFRGLLLRGLLTWGAQWGAQWSAKWGARRGLSGQFSARFSRVLAIRIIFSSSVLAAKIQSVISFCWLAGNF